MTVECISREYNPHIPSEIAVIVRDSNLSSNQKIITIKLLAFIYCNAFSLVRMPSTVLDKWQGSHKDRTKAINFLIDECYIKPYQYYSRKQRRATTYQVNKKAIERIAINSRFIYHSSYDALKGIKPPANRQTLKGISNKVKQCLRGFELYIKPIEALKISKNIDENKADKWKSFLSTGAVTGWNKPSFRTDDTFKRISTYKPNIQGIPKIYRNTTVIPQARFDIDYCSQHLYISIGLNDGSFIADAWECLQLATGLDKEFIKSIVNPYYFGQSMYSCIADKIGIRTLSKDKKKNAFIRISKVKQILNDKSNPLHMTAIYYQEKYCNVISNLEKMKAQRPEDPKQLMIIGANIMNKVISSNTNAYLFPIYDGIITDTNQTAENLKDNMPYLAETECKMPIPVKIRSLIAV